MSYLTLWPIPVLSYSVILLGDQAEEFHDTVQMLLEWLADAEQSLKFQGPLSEDPEAIKEQIETHKVCVHTYSIEYTHKVCVHTYSIEYTHKVCVHTYSIESQGLPSYLFHRVLTRFTFILIP